MKCPHCDQEHAEGLQFCPITDKEILLPGVCPQCGKPVDPKWQHCGYCGQVLDQRVEVQNQMTAHPQDQRIPGPGTSSQKTPWRIMLFVIGGLLILSVLFIVIRKLNNTGKTALSVNTETAAAEQAVIPAILPDKIVFASIRDGNFEIYSMNPDGSDQTRLTNNQFYDGGPAWSPDGQKIAFFTDRNGYDQIYSMDIDGSHQANLTNSASFDSYPDWSPDGQKIAFESSRDGNVEIYIMNADGSDQIRLTYDQNMAHGPRWSPDGQRIAYSAEFEGNEEVYVMNADGSGQTDLTYNPAHPAGEHYPSWSPDGEKIAYLTQRDGNCEIYTMNVDGTDQTSLTHNIEYSGYSNFKIECFNGQFDWSPDGRKIAFISMNPENYDIFVLDIDGKNVTPLTTSPANDWVPRWSPGLSKQTFAAKPSIKSTPQNAELSSPTAAPIPTLTPALVNVTPLPAAGIIEGRVYRSDTDRSIANATVILIKKEGTGTFEEKIFAVTTTDENGRYSFMTVNPASYQLWLSLEKIPEYLDYPFCSDAIPEDWIAYLTAYPEIPLALLAPNMEFTVAAGDEL